MSTTYKLMYYNGRGLAELSRYIFEVSGQPHEDFRWEEKDWPAYKHNTPFGQCPVLELNESGDVYQVSQSKSIARFLANRFNLAGASAAEKAKADMVVDQLSDLYYYYGQANYRQTSEEARKKEVEKFVNEKMPVYYGSLEAWLARSGTAFFAGDEMTFADFDVALAVDRDFGSVTGSELDSLERNYPLVKLVCDRVNRLPAIAAWKAKRPETWF